MIRNFLSLYLFLFTLNLYAVNYTWDDGVTGDWEVPSNWDLNSNYPGTATNDLGIIQNGNVNINSGNSIDLSGGGYVIVGNSSGTSGNLVMSNAYFNTTYYHFGWNGTGNVILSGGNLNIATGLYLGTASAGNGYMHLMSGNIVGKDTSTALYVGSAGTGTFTQDGGSISVARFYIASSGTGTYNMKSGTLDISTLMILSDNSAGNSTLNLSGGTFKNSASNAYIASNGNTQINQTGGNLHLAGANSNFGYNGQVNYEMRGGYHLAQKVRLGYNGANSNGNIIIYDGTVITKNIEIAEGGTGRLEVHSSNFTAETIDMKSGNATLRVVGPSANLQISRYQNSSANSYFECILSTNNGHFIPVNCSSVVDMSGHLKVGLDGGVLMASGNTFDLMIGAGDAGNNYASTPAMWDVNLINDAYGTKEAVRVALATGNLQASLDLNGTGNVTLASQPAGYVTVSNVDTSALSERGLAILLDVQTGTSNTVVNHLVSAGYNAELFAKGIYDIRIVLDSSDLTTGTAYFVWDFTDVSSSIAYSYLDNLKFEIPKAGTFFRFE